MLYTNKGFTLIEIGIVLFVVGILVAVFIPNFTQGIRDKATAELLIRQSKKHFDNLKIIADSCNLAVDSIEDINRKSTISTPSNAYFTEIMLKGSAAVSNTYKYCYNQSNVKYTGYADKFSSLSGVLALENQRNILVVPTSTTYQINYLTYSIAIEVIKQLNLDPNDYPFSVGAMYYPAGKAGMTIYSDSNVGISLVN